MPAVDGVHVQLSIGLHQSRDHWFIIHHLVSGCSRLMHDYAGRHGQTTKTYWGEGTVLFVRVSITQLLCAVYTDCLSSYIPVYTVVWVTTAWLPILYTSTTVHAVVMYYLSSPYFCFSCVVYKDSQEKLIAMSCLIVLTIWWS